MVAARREGRVKTVPRPASAGLQATGDVRARAAGRWATTGSVVGAHLPPPDPAVSPAGVGLAPPAPPLGCAPAPRLVGRGTRRGRRPVGARARRHRELIRWRRADVRRHPGTPGVSRPRTGADRRL